MKFYIPIISTKLCDKISIKKTLDPNMLFSSYLCLYRLLQHFDFSVTIKKDSHSNIEHDWRTIADIDTIFTFKTGKREFILCFTYYVTSKQYTGKL